jgi:hypothetical protein
LVVANGDGVEVDSDNMLMMMMMKEDSSDSCYHQVVLSRLGRQKLQLTSITHSSLENSLALYSPERRLQLVSKVHLIGYPWLLLTIEKLGVA